MYNVFYVLLLEQDNIRKGHINKFLIPEFEASNNKKY